LDHRRRSTKEFEKSRRQIFGQNLGTDSVRLNVATMDSIPRYLIECKKLDGIITSYYQHPLVPTALARLGYDPQKLLDGMHKHCSDRGYPNGYIYYGGGGVETPSIIPATVDEMLLQSFTGELRLFPTWPVKHDASFTNLRAYGAFLVSSSMKSGEIQDIAIYSERGRRCSLKNPWPGKNDCCYPRRRAKRKVDG
jgi:hypothetical protein